MTDTAPEPVAQDYLFAGLPAERWRTGGDGNVDTTRYGAIRLSGEVGVLLVGTFTCDTCGDVGQYAFQGRDVIALGKIGIVFITNTQRGFRVRAKSPERLEVICAICEWAGVWFGKAG